MVKTPPRVPPCRCAAKGNAAESGTELRETPPRTAIRAPCEYSRALYLSQHFILVEIICANQSETKFTKILAQFSLKEINQLTLTREN